MNAFVSIAKVTFSTLVAAFTAFIAFCAAWYACVLVGFQKGALMLLYLNEYTTVCIGLASGWFVARHYRTRPYLSAAISAGLVEALHIAVGGTGMLALPLAEAWRVTVVLLAAAIIAMATAWLLMLIIPPPAPAPVVAADASPGNTPAS